MLVAVGACLSGMSPTSGAEQAPSLQAGTLEELVKQYVELRAEAVRLHTDWQEQKAVLEAELALLSREIDAARKALRRQQDRNAALEQTLKAAVEQRKRLQQTLAGVRSAVAREEEKLRRFVATLPPPLRKRVEGAGSAPTPTTESGGLVERLAALLKELEAVQSVDQEVHIERMMLPGPDGSPQEAQVLFIGLGAAYALSADGRMGALARIGREGWSWVWLADLAPAIREAVERHTRVRPPGFVTLPVEIRVHADTPSKSRNGQ